MSPSVMPPARERALRKQDIMLTMIWGIIHRKRRNATHILSTGDTNLEQQLGERSLQRRLVTGGKYDKNGENDQTITNKYESLQSPYMHTYMQHIQTYTHTYTHVS